ncbi:MAG: TonB-dependent receptor plug domain-containing protein [Chitinophagaceae bacterium]|nr:TonB-dependent receptor plug domain-containing protein [Chitinophagaceae bacterium]
MPVLIDYIIKLNICLAVVYLFYQLFLRRLTFYNWNRWYLVGYTILSFIIPLINVMPSLQKQKLEGSVMLQWIPAIGFGAEKQTNFFESLTSWDWVIATLALGSLLLLFRLIVRLFAFAKMKTRARVLSDDTTKIYQLDDKITPFSFGNAIFINTNLHDDAELEEIIRHEFVHVKQNHSIDIIWCELLCILNWFNPFVWLIRHNVRQNLEFLADDKVLQNGLDKTAYQYLLLKVIGNQQFAFTNHFNFSSLKKRIAMMNTIKSAKLNVMRFLFLLPVIAVLLLSFRNEMKESIEPANDKTVNITAPLLKSGTAKNPENNIHSNKIIPADTIPAKKQEAQNLIGVISGKNDTATPKKPIYIINGIRLNDDNWQINSVDPNSIESIEIMKQPESVSLYGEEGKNGVIMITTKPPGKNTLQLRNMPANEPLYILDGTIVDANVIYQLKQNNIESVSVFKGQNALSLYGAKAKNGAVSIVTKKNSNTIGVVSAAENGQVKMKKGDVEIIADTILIKEKEGIVKDTLPGAERLVGTIDYSYQHQDLKPRTVTGYKLDNSLPENIPSDAYYVLNGKHVSEKQIKKLPPNTIKSMDVLKGDSALKFYGKKAKNGAIVIVTK